MPYLSVVIPLYNKEKQIQRTIDSVLAQEFEDYELIVINDGSSDHSQKIVEDIQDERIKLINQPNAGVSAARNRGIKEAVGKYVVFLDADDCFLPGAFSLLNEAPDVDIIVGSFIETDDAGYLKKSLINKFDGLIERNYQSYWRREYYTRMGNMFIKRDLFQKCGYLRTDFTLYEDKEWNLRLLDEAKLYISTKIILDYNRATSGLSHGFVSIEKDFANIASVKKIKDNYKKKVVGDFVFRRFVHRLKERDWQGMTRIWHNNSWNMLFCMISCLVGYYRDKKRGNNKLILVSNDSI